MRCAALRCAAAEVSSSNVVVCSCGDGWLTIDLIYSGAVTVPAQQPLKGTPHQLQVQTTSHDVFMHVQNWIFDTHILHPHFQSRCLSWHKS